MMKINNIKYLAILAIGLVGCEPEFEKPIDQANYTSGEADFSKYVALGNSITAGYGAGALYITGQENSYPNILAKQFALVGGGNFIQPLMSDNAGGLLLNGTIIQDPVTGANIFPNRLVLAYDDNGKNPGPAIYTGAAPTTDLANILTGPFNNMGAPGARSYHLIAKGYGNLANLPFVNPYFGRMASSPNVSIIEDAVDQNPTFFSLWIGSNDILGYTTNGAAGIDHNQTGNVNPSTYSNFDLTNINVFANSYKAVLDSITANGAKGVLVSLGNTTSIPFSTTVPYAPLVPIDEDGVVTDFGTQVSILNQNFSGLNSIFEILEMPERMIHFSETTASPVVIIDESLPDLSTQITGALIQSGVNSLLAGVFGEQYGQARQATPDDLLGLRSSSIIGQVDQDRVAELVSEGLPLSLAGQFSVNGVTLPLEDKQVLTPEEQAGVTTAVTAFNAIIKGFAEEYGLAFYDASSDLAKLENEGVPYDGGMLTSQFVRGGAFTLDGVHPTPRGHAFIANRILDAIESKYGTKVPRVAIGDYGTITVNNEVN